MNKFNMKMVKVMKMDHKIKINKQITNIVKMIMIQNIIIIIIITNKECKIGK